MRGVRLNVRLVVLLLLVSALPGSAQIIFPPPASAWDLNGLMRHDPRPLELYLLANAPTIDGSINPSEWQGATPYQVLNPQSGQLLGVLYAGIFEDYLYIANNWVVNTDPNPANGGGNAWRFGTATGPGPGNVGQGPWYEVYVQEAGSTDMVFARQAANEAGLPLASFVSGSSLNIFAGSTFNGSNWQYELNMRVAPLPFCWGWEWRQLDPSPGDGIWVPAFNGTAHNNNPEPCTFVLLAAGVAGLRATAMRRRRQAQRLPQ